MNPLTTSTPDLEALRQAVQDYQPNPHRVPFNDLKPVHDFIMELRRQNASYSAIADLLQQHGIKTSRARVAEYGRIVLGGGKSRKRRKHAKAVPAVNIPAQPQSVPTPATPVLSVAPMASAPPSSAGDSSYRSRGPRIAKIRMMTPAEAKAFNDDLKRPES